MENIGNLHGVSHSHQTGDLMNSPHARQSATHRNLVSSHGRSAMVSSMASILDGAGEYRTDHSLSGPLHPAMSMSCDSSMNLSSTYTTLTPLQHHLPPISNVSEKFHHHHPHPHPHAHHHPAHQRLAAGNVSGSFTLMRDDRGLASMSNLYGHYSKELSGMGPPLSPLSNGLGSLHNSQQTLSAYGPTAHLGNDKMISTGGFETHAAMLGRGEEHLARGLGGHGAGIMSSLNGINHHHHSHSHSQANGSVLSERDRQAAGGGQGGGSGQVEEINTKEVAQRITAELKRYSIPQAIFAQRILCRSQGTLSDLLRNPKPWSKLKSGRETFRRMWKWLQEPEFQRMSALRLAGEWGSLKFPRAKEEIKTITQNLYVLLISPSILFNKVINTLCMEPQTFFVLNSCAWHLTVHLKSSVPIQKDNILQTIMIKTRRKQTKKPRYLKLNKTSILGTSKTIPLTDYIFADNIFAEQI